MVVEKPALHRGTRRAPHGPGEILVLRRDLGEFGAPAPRPLPDRAPLRLARPLLRGSRPPPACTPRTRSPP